ncbi:MAG: dTMP kinase [Candidatus Bathyarchaeia archaeon]
MNERQRPLRKKRGLLIAIEGIDQAGKRTQASLLAKKIRSLGLPVSVWSFPDYTTPLGRQLKAYLAGKIQLDLHSVHLLYAANKWELAGELAHRIKRGGVVIVNRYSPSNLAYGIAHGLPPAWLNSLEEGLPKPDVVVVLDVTSRTSFIRKSQERDLHEGDLTYLRRVRRAYLRLARKYRWKIVDGQYDSETVRGLVWDIIYQFLR